MSRNEQAAHTEASEKRNNNLKYVLLCDVVLASILLETSVGSWPSCHVFLFCVFVTVQVVDVWAWRTASTDIVLAQAAHHLLIVCLVNLERKPDAASRSLFGPTVAVHFLMTHLYVVIFLLSNYSTLPMWLMLVNEGAVASSAASGSLPTPIAVIALLLLLVRMRIFVLHPATIPQCSSLLLGMHPLQACRVGFLFVQAAALLGSLLFS